MNADRTIPNVLSIAGVDPSGGAGILADVKAISANGAYACAVVAALTAQNTVGVDGIFPVPPDFVRMQIDTLWQDVRVDAVEDRHGRAGTGHHRWSPNGSRTGGRHIWCSIP